MPQVRVQLADGTVREVSARTAAILVAEGRAVLLEETAVDQPVVHAARVDRDPRITRTR